MDIFLIFVVHDKVSLHNCRPLKWPEATPPKKKSQLELVLVQSVFLPSGLRRPPHFFIYLVAVYFCLSGLDDACFRFAPLFFFLSESALLALGGFGEDVWKSPRESDILCGFRLVLNTPPDSFLPSGSRVPD